MVKFTAKGDFKSTKDFLTRASRGEFFNGIEKLAQEGVQALEVATPKDTGLTSQSWTYDIVRTPEKLVITWHNTNFNKGVPIALVLQYGHGTGTGGYVTGIDYINPAMKPIFDKIEEYVMKEVNRK